MSAQEDGGRKEWVTLGDASGEVSWGRDSVIVVGIWWPLCRDVLQAGAGRTLRNGSLASG